MMKIVSAEKTVDKLVEEYNENIDESEIIYNATLNDHENICGSCILYIVLLVIASLIIIGISSVFIYFHWDLTIFFWNNSFLTYNL